MTCGAVFQHLLRAEQMIQHFNICAAGGARGGNVPSGSPAVLSHCSAATNSPQNCDNPVGDACGVASAYPRLIPSEAGLATSDSPAALSHHAAAIDSPKNCDNPAGQSLRGCLRVSAVDSIRGGPCPLGLPCSSVSPRSRNRSSQKQRQPRRPKPAGLPLYDAANAAISVFG